MQLLPVRTICYPMNRYSFCCITIGARGVLHCGKSYIIDDGDRSYLLLLSSNDSSFVVNNNTQICVNHYNHYLRPKSKRCISPFCTNTSSKSLRECPKHFLIYLNLHDQAKVMIHTTCFNEIRARLSVSGSTCSSVENTTNTSTNSSNSSINTNHSNDNSNHRAPLADITNRENEITCYQFVQAVRSQSLPSSFNAATAADANTSSTRTTPIKLTGKRGRSIHLQQLPNCEVDFTQCGSTNKRTRIELISSTIAHLSHNPHSSTEQNETNRIQLLTELINSNATQFEQAFKQSKLHNSLTTQLTENQMLELKNIGNLTWKQLRAMRSYLYSANMNILPSERKTRETLAEYTSFDYLLLLEKQLLK